MKNKKSSSRVHDLVILCALPLGAAVATWWLALNYLEAILLFFGLPAIYLSLRKPTIIRRALAFALPISIIAVLGDYLAARDGSWFVPTVFHFRVFGLVSIENLIWFFLVSYLVVGYYESFYDHAAHKTIGRRLPYLYLILASIILVMSLIILSGHSFSINYFYLKSGLVLALLPLLTFLFEFPRFLNIFMRITPYFVALFFLNEIVGLHKGYWSFPGGDFLGWININGYRFPYEELIFYVLLFSSVILTYFELFDDNRLKFRLKRP